MKISPLVEYGVRVTLQLARIYPQSSISASQLAQLEGLSVEYCSKILYILKNTAIVSAERGKSGGHSLICAPSNITLWQLIEIFDPQGAQTTSAEFCDRFRAQEDACVHRGKCSLKLVWQVLDFISKEITQGIYLSDLLDHKNLDSKKLLDILQSKLKVMVGEQNRPLYDGQIIQ